MEIGKRLEQFRKRHNIKMPAIAAETGISKENLYKWEKGTKPSNFEVYNHLITYLDRKEREIASGEPQPEVVLPKKKEPPTFKSLLSAIPIFEPAKPILLTDEGGVPGKIIKIGEAPFLVVRRNDCGLIGNVDGLILVMGECIDGRYPSGSWIGLRRLPFITILNSGSYYYIIDKNLQATVGRVRCSEHDQRITLYAEKPGILEIHRDIKDILSVFSIEAVIYK